MTLTKDIAAKLAVAFVAAAMVFSAFASTASAQTTEDLQQMINDLLAQVATLQSQIGQGGTSVAAGVCPYTWTRDLSSGSNGMDVMKLQQFLNADPDTRVAVSGAGSAGMETEYYGPATAAAVSKMQVKYRADILSPANLVNPTGYFGPSSRAKANALCVAAPVVDDSSDDMPVDDTDDMMDDDDDDTDSSELSGEAALNTFEVDDAEDDTLEEGAEDEAVAEVTVEFEDGDAEISRIDVSFDTSAITATTDPWDVLESVSIWVDGDKVAEEDADSDRDFLSDDMTIRFSGLDIIAMEDEEVEITIAATLRDGIDSVDQGTVSVQVESIRFFDADGVATTETEGTGEESVMDGGTATFVIEEAGADDELRARTSSNDPDGTTLQVEEDSDSDWYTIFVFDLDTDDSVNDIELNRIDVVVDLAVGTGTYDVIVDDAELVIDGTVIDDVTVTGGNTQSATLSFDVDGDVVIDAGDRVEAELMLQFNGIDSNQEGLTVQGSIVSLSTTNVEAEGADDLDNTQLSGAATGDEHTIRTKGVDVSLEDASAVVTAGASELNADDYGTYTIEVEVTAFEQDVYIDVDPANSIGYVLEDGASVAAVAGTRTVQLTSTGEEVSGTFEITEGSTETLTITVTYTPGVAQTAARMQLVDIDFGETAGAPTGQTWTASPEETYRTEVVTMVN